VKGEGGRPLPEARSQRGCCPRAGQRESAATRTSRALPTRRLRALTTRRWRALPTRRTIALPTRRLWVLPTRRLRALGWFSKGSPCLPPCQ
jgi:hypothetical protein